MKHSRWMIGAGSGAAPVRQPKIRWKSGPIGRMHTRLSLESIKAGRSYMATRSRESGAPLAIVIGLRWDRRPETSVATSPTSAEWPSMMQMPQGITVACQVAARGLAGFDGAAQAVAIPTASLRTMRRGAMHYGFIEWLASGSCQVVRRSPGWTIETSLLSEARHRSSGCSVGMRTQEHVAEFRGRQAGAAVRGTWERIFSIPRSSFVARFLLTLTH